MVDTGQFVTGLDNGLDTSLTGVVATVLHTAHTMPAPLTTVYTVQIVSV